jgi:hypothetical protein
LKLFDLSDIELVLVMAKTVNIFLLVLARSAQARRVDKNVNNLDDISAITALLLAANPELSRIHARLRNTGPAMLISELNPANTGVGSIAEFVKDGRRELGPKPIGLGQGGIDNKVYDDSQSELLQGGSLKTWSFTSPSVERVQVVLTTEGRPLDADLELWNGPDHTPCKMRVYSEDGARRPFSVVLDTARAPNTVAIRNIGSLETPLAAQVVANEVDEPKSDFLSTSMIVQGGALRTYPFAPDVQSVEVMLATDGRPLNARIELLQGPNTNKQVIELYTEDGINYPFFAIIETPGNGNVVRLVNTGPVEFPLTASVQPHWIDDRVSNFNFEPVIGNR